MEYSAQADAVLVVSIGRYQEEALAEAYRRHGAAVHALARRVSGSAATADDVTQEVFLDLWRRPERFDGSRGTLRTWLLTAAHGRTVDVLRAEKSRAARQERVGTEAVGTYDLEHFAWDLAQGDQVRAALEALPGDERRAIEMAYFDGLTYREVALRLDEPEGTIKSRIRAGLRRMRLALSRLGVEVS